MGFGGGERGGLPAFVPARFAPAINRAAQRWSVSAALLAAQLYAESGFNPFDAAASIDAQAHLMRDLLRQFASVPLALAAYNAGAGAVARCGCIPPYAETQGYVARILGLLNGAGDPTGLTGMEVRLIK